MRVALFGGTFDPIHCGHLRVARAAADAFALDRVLFAPAGRQPLKTASASASFEDRLAMVTLAVAHPCEDQAGPDPRLGVTSLDAPRRGDAPNYTVDLLEEFARIHPEVELFAIAGADSFLSLPHWRAPERVLALAQWIVVSRPGLELTRTIKPAFLARPEFAPLALTPDQRARIHLLPGIHEDISATALRNALENAANEAERGFALDEWIPSAAADYIREQDLYRCCPPA